MVNNLLIELKRLKALDEFNELRERMNNSPQTNLKNGGSSRQYPVSPTENKTGDNLNFIGGTNGR